MSTTPDDVSAHGGGHASFWMFTYVLVVIVIPSVFIVVAFATSIRGCQRRRRALDPEKNAAAPSPGASNPPNPLHAG